MDEHVGAVVLFDEPPALLIIEPLDLTHRHWLLHTSTRTLQTFVLRSSPPHPPDPLRFATSVKYRNRGSQARSSGRRAACGPALMYALQGHVKRERASAACGHPSP